MFGSVILENPWKNEFLDYVKATEKELFILTPFFDKFTLDQVLERVRTNVNLSNLV